MTSLKKYIRKIDESVLGFINNKKTKPLKRHAQIGESDEQVGLYDTDEDRWSRNAKRHFSKADLQNVLAKQQQQEFDLNESVTYQGRQAVVRILRGPNNTVGIMMEGRMRMVKRADIVKLDEGVLGSMTGLEPLNRVMQLAGIAGAYNTGELGEHMIVEDETEQTFSNLSRENLNQVNQNQQCARLYTVGQMLVAISKQLDPNSYDSTAIKTALSKQNLATTLGPMGISFMQEAKTLSAQLQGK